MEITNSHNEYRQGGGDVELLLAVGALNLNSLPQ